jgi:hypothetical protein
MTTSATVALRPVNAPIIPNLLPVGAQKNKVGGQTWLESANAPLESSWKIRSIATTPALCASIAAVDKSYVRGGNRPGQATSRNKFRWKPGEVQV